MHLHVLLFSSIPQRERKRETETERDRETERERERDRQTDRGRDRQRRAMQVEVEVVVCDKERIGEERGDTSAAGVVLEGNNAPHAACWRED